jgi:hypothetical protein
MGSLGFPVLRKRNRGGEGLSEKQPRRQMCRALAKRTRLVPDRRRRGIELLAGSRHERRSHAITKSYGRHSVQPVQVLNFAMTLSRGARYLVELCLADRLIQPQSTQFRRGEPLRKPLAIRHLLRCPEAATGDQAHGLTCQVHPDRGSPPVRVMHL